MNRVARSTAHSENRVFPQPFSAAKESSSTEPARERRLGGGPWTLCGLLCLICIVLAVALPNATAQRRIYGGYRGTHTQQALRRIEALEQRVAALERLVGRQMPAVDPEATVPTVEGAQRRLEAAREHLAYSQDVFRKGYISEAELETDRYLCERAEIVLEMARAAREGASLNKLESALQARDAKHDLRAAQRQLQLARRLRAQGLVGATSIEAHREAVAEAQRRVDRAAAERQPPQE